jgi:hypothetical protein
MCSENKESEVEQSTSHEDKDKVGPSVYEIFGNISEAGEAPSAMEKEPIVIR